MKAIFKPSHLGGPLGGLSLYDVIALNDRAIFFVASIIVALNEGNNHPFIAFGCMFKSGSNSSVHSFDSRLRLMLRFKLMKVVHGFGLW